MKKIYVLDTNVLLQDHRAIFAFEEHDVVIPAVVIEEIDAKKRLNDELGRNARAFSRLLDSLRQKGKLHSGVPLPSGGTLRVELNHKARSLLMEHFSESTNDNRILTVALNLHLEEQEKPQPRPVILVSMDANIRIKADTLDILAEDFKNSKIVTKDEYYQGFAEVIVPGKIIDNFYKDKGKSLDIEKTPLKDETVYPNQFFILKDENGSSKSALCRFDGVMGRLAPIHQVPEVWGIAPRNAQQKMALDLLLNDEVQIVTLTGRAGTGKTLLSLAVGLLKTEDEHIYKKLLVARPVIPMGKDIGFLPGELNDKLRPWMQPIYDNLEHLFQTHKGKDLDGILAGLKSIQVEALTYIRGRSIPQQFIIIDEAQNLTRHEVKTIISRCGEGSKIVLVGDPEQIDHPYLDASNNGLTHVVERFKGEKIAGHVTLVKGERSPLAQLAADLL